MPSSNKTGHLQLNRWLGEDKPKREDFNEDNLKVDDACRELSGLTEEAARQRALLDREQERQKGLLGGLEGRCGALEKTAGRLEADVEGLERGQSALQQSQSTHAADKALHVSAAEKAEWAGGVPTVGMYLGDGKSQQSVNVGFKPKNGYFFPVNSPPVKFSAQAGELFACQGFFSSRGCTKGVSLYDAGFTVSNSVGGGADGVALRFNEDGEMYAYFAWK